MGRIIHFEIPFTNVAAIRTFYSNVFNWGFTKWEGPEEYWLITTGKDDEPGINGGLIPTIGEMKGMINTISVDNLDQVLAGVMANGGQEVMPKMAVPGVGWLAYAKDPEGTMFGMMQADPDAHR